MHCMDEIWHGFWSKKTTFWEVLGLVYKGFPRSSGVLRGPGPHGFGLGRGSVRNVSFLLISKQRGYLIPKKGWSEWDSSVDHSVTSLEMDSGFKSRTSIDTVLQEWSPPRKFGESNSQTSDCSSQRSCLVFVHLTSHLLLLNSLFF